MTYSIQGNKGKSQPIHKVWTIEKQLARSENNAIIRRAWMIELWLPVRVESLPFRKLISHAQNISEELPAPFRLAPRSRNPLRLPCISLPLTCIPPEPIIGPILVNRYV